jgi:Sap, sulfolipid-1-addressing protein
MDLLIDVVVIALAIALEPIPILAFILTLASGRGRAAGWAFLFGWLLSLVVIVWIAVGITGGQGVRPGSSPATATYAVDAAIGAGLVAFSYVRHRRTPPPSPVSGRLMGRIESINLWGAIGIGVVIQPWVLVAAGATNIMRAKLSAPAIVVAMALFALLATSILLAIELQAVRNPVASAERLAKLRRWLEQHRDPVVVWVSLLVGLYLLGRGVYGLL